MNYNDHIQFLKQHKIRMAQNHTEFKRLCELVEEQKPRVLVEIGTRDGGSLYMLAQYAPVDCRIISIDLPGAAWGRASSETNRLRVADMLRAQGREVTLIDGDSHSKETANKLKETLTGEEIDVLFIDGDHSFDGILQDWNIYQPFLADDAICAFHDIDNAAHLPKVQVHYLWRVLRNVYPNFIESIANPGKGYGIGILYHKKGLWYS